LRQLIAGSANGVILIRPNQVISWANHAALVMHGVERLADLGATVSEYRARFELFHRDRHRLVAGAYPMERLLAGEALNEMTIDVAPAGQKRQRWTHRIRSMVLTNARGQPDCLALILEDQTARFRAEERFEQAFAANPAPAIILRLADLRYVKANRGFLDLMGYDEVEVLGRTIPELDVLEGAKQREFALEQLREGCIIPQMEAWPRLRGGIPKLVLVAGQPIEIDDAACMLLTFADLEPRRRAEAALHQSEDRFEKAFRLAPVPMAIASLEDWFRFTLVNTAFVEATGYTEAASVGRTAAELGLWTDPAAAANLERRLQAAGTARSVEVRLKGKDGNLLDCLLSAEAVSIDGRRCALWVMQDVTERRRTEAELAAAIEAVMRDTSWFSRTILEKLAKLRLPVRAEALADGVTNMTPRGLEVLGLVCRGLDDGAIAERLGISRTTVRNHVNDLYQRTDARGRAALVVWARERGFAGEERSGTRRRRRKQAH
jgi:PAS domain S-box-containing protein